MFPSVVLKNISKGELFLKITGLGKQGKEGA